MDFPEAQKPASNPSRASSPQSYRATVSGLLSGHWGALILGLAVVGAETAAALLEPWPIKVVLDTVLHAKPLPQPLSRAIATTLGTSSVAILEFAVVAVLLIAIVGAVGSYIEKQCVTTLGQRVTHELRCRIYTHAQRLSMSYHDKKRTGDVISTATADVDAIQSAITSGILDTLYYTLLLVGMASLMLYLDWQFTLVALSIIPVLGVVVFTLTRRIKRASRDVRSREADLMSTMQEVLSSIRLVKAFGRQDHERHRFEYQSEQIVESTLRARDVKAKLAPSVEIIVAFGSAAVLWFGARHVLDGVLTAGALVVFLLYLSKMYKPIRELSKMADTYTRALVALDRINGFLGVDVEVRDLPGARRARRFHGRIELDHVTFAYSPDHTTLADVSLTIPAGSVAAVVGPTGAGKTTLINLVARFYDPQSGRVLIDGEDVRSFYQESLRERISFVLQDTLLFRGPVWQNIAYGRSEATRREIVRAAELANADAFIRELPDGYDTMVGERGVTLSGGQQQRIAIARAIVRDAPILILDEPTTGLDAASESLVLDALRQLMRGKTTIVIAHSLTTVQHADQIFVMDHGRVCERGTHAALLEAGGMYSRLYELQFARGTALRLTTSPSSRV
ncbi:MAG TPA: ABC transporter ATP-binding protein [Gemmatimonadaceae bacterium]|nr:ABC transporter ATP-binding protein [Gemmatimonadaceae bacterium]